MVTAALVKELREKTGAGMMDCKKVLTETDGDLEKAAELLREKGITKAAKKSGRVAVEEHIKECIDEAREVRLNTWQAAVYESVLECEWFWNKYL